MNKWDGGEGKDPLTEIREMTEKVRTHGIDFDNMERIYDAPPEIEDKPLLQIEHKDDLPR